jgi:hypothetical protein
MNCLSDALSSSKVDLGTAIECSNKSVTDSRLGVLGTTEHGQWVCQTRTGTIKQATTSTQAELQLHPPQKHLPHFSLSPGLRNVRVFLYIKYS